MERAGTGLPGGPGAGAVLHLLLGHAVGQHLLVVSVDHLSHIGAGGVGNLEVGTVKDLPHGAVLGEALIDQCKELCSNVGLDIDREWRIPIDDLTFPLPLGLALLVRSI